MRDPNNVKPHMRSYLVLLEMTVDDTRIFFASIKAEHICKTAGYHQQTDSLKSKKENAIGNRYLS